MLKTRQFNKLGPRVSSAYSSVPLYFKFQKYALKIKFLETFDLDIKMHAGILGVKFKSVLTSEISLLKLYDLQKVSGGNKPITLLLLG